MITILDLGLPFLQFLAFFGVGLAKVMAVVLGADLLIATAHYLMDRFGDPTCRPGFLATIFANNRLHHAFPRLLLRHGPFANATETLGIGAAIAIVAWTLGLLTWEVLVFSSVVAFSAVVHRWQHLPVSEVCCLVKWLQSQGVVQTRVQHATHHRFHDVNYAVLTDAANFFLERTRALYRLEQFVVRCLGFAPVDLRAVTQKARDEARLAKK